VAAMGALKASLGFIDLPRACTPEPQKLFSWWGYRALDFRMSNRGLRLDHILVSPGLKGAAFRLGCASARVHDDCREWPKPSDHAPVSADLVL
ncbi:MAG: exodeoxyribonuclease III, partial [Phenylobacterium sp.]|nr:exodeoxyribonuclease III [Phenylobacterium sp.]